MPNRLAAESSPYLLQHKDNPVDWYAWGDEALARARSEDRPLLVSIGYSACHWCHVMEHESFEDAEIAALMNDNFVCIKVDREERPDVDAVCMEACQAMTGQGGWPLNAFLTPDQAPFFVGTYYPPAPRHGMPSWRAVLEAVASAWRDRRDDVREQGAQILGSLGGGSRLPATDHPITSELLDAAVAGLRGNYDAAHGGFGGAPKFPQASVIEFLLARGEREMSLGMLRAMATGGIYDQVGGGFARYSVDATWTVPHFEKMLYDNALLARAYLHGFQVSGEPLLARVCRETLDWTLRELRGPEGGFCSALDADSEGVEGKYYAWTVAELRAALASDPALAERAIAFFGVSEGGNFEGANVLEGRGPALSEDELAAVRTRLYEVRERRVRPGLDDKRLCSWNALMISALAEAGAVLGEPVYLDAAVDCAAFVLRDMVADGRLQRTYKDGRAHIDAYLEDHAYLLEALLTLYEATFDPRWYDAAVQLAEVLRDRFADSDDGGFYTTSIESVNGFARRKDLDDAPTPSGGSAAAFGLLRLSALSGDGTWESLALGVLRVVAGIVGRYPTGFGHALQALDFYVARVREVAIVGDGPEFDELVRVVRRAYRPHVVIAGGPAPVAPADAVGGGDAGSVALADTVPLLRDRGPVDGRPAAYVCEGFVCRAPVTDADALAAAL